ncbi:Non-catalytic module family EXPN [Melampsora larici-populina 98AG31]|uniref:Non-catalytic module family EXPN n=1 Tax=Melampsora larici-populina (strain 98AG31 / pathotype 3-4-7) TaxID=747676 RepID=F4S5D7_MELLP|nr:Non-catalytic module family EXPN [Melampsora larici-populina 98AG31]EGG00179.1 Non-catalytic module family EXPN [Melampsora larici-populina 98AG31]
MFLLITSSIIPLSGRAANTAHTTKSHGGKKLARRKYCLPKRPAPTSSQFQSQGTNWHGNWETGNCAYKQWPRPQDLGYIAIASNQWKDAAACGACISVTGPGGTFTGIVGDQCPSCLKDALDLDDSLWKQVSGNQSPGIVKITWSFVPCGFSEPMKFINKEGTSGYWNSIQVAGSSTPIKSLEITKQGTENWTVMKLQSNSNYWQLGNGGIGETADIKVTCQDGSTFTTKGVDVATPQKVTSAESNCK